MLTDGREPPFEGWIVVRQCEMTNAADEIERLQTERDDAIKQLHGPSQSKLDGDGGLAAATWRDNRRLAKRCDEEQAENERLRKDIDCGGGPAGCLNTRRMCRSCLIQESAAAEAARGE